MAAAGRQPRGDATAIDHGISLQAKRYRQTTPLNSLSVAADLLFATESSGEELDVYVVATTREASQLRQELEVFEKRTGVDVLVISDDEYAPELTALCVTYWQHARPFFPSADAALDAWACEVARQSWVVEAVERVRAKIQFGLRTFADLRVESRKALTARFHPQELRGSAAGVRVELGSAVERKKPAADLLAWWTEGKNANSFLKAEEGFGKTWVGAAFAEALAKLPDASPVFWLESSEWSGCTSIESVLESALRTVLPAGDPRVGAFQRKILRRWPKPVLLVLDGVNERDCVQAAQRLLRTYTRHASIYAAKLRILFTTRPLDGHPDYQPEVWEGSREIPVGEFTKDEFDAALRHLAPDVPIDSVPENIRRIASVPRFFKLALRLRDRLRDLGQLSKPVLLFADLTDKIERRMLASLFPSTSTAEEVLAHWAKHSQRTVAGAILVADAHVQSCFGNFSQALADLAEHRIAEKRIGSVAINADHVVLGFALHLLQLADEKRNASGAELINDFALALEPNREDDIRTEALYVALLLTFLRPAAAGDWREARRALLSLWAGSHNARQTTERLRFWATTDEEIYYEVVEYLFRDYLSGSQDTDLIAPIAKRWREKGVADTALMRRLERWLTFVYPPVDPEDSVDKAAARAAFPSGTSASQLRLTAVAMSIISLRPEIELLPALAASAHSSSFCTAIHNWDGKPHKTAVKSSHESLGLLLEWHYTERVIPYLAKIAESALAPQREAFWTLGDCFDRSRLPVELTRPGCHARSRRDDSDATKFKDWLAKLPCADLHWPRIFKFELLADSPRIRVSDHEFTMLADYLLATVSSAKGHPGMDETAEVFKPLLPWVAKGTPALFPGIAKAYWTYAIRSTNPNGASIDSPFIPLPPSDFEELFTEMKGVSVSPAPKPTWGLVEALLKTVVISVDDNQLINILARCIEFPSSNIGDECWRILPVPYMLARVQSRELAEECWRRFDAFRRDPAEARASRYWLQLAAAFSRTDPVSGERALREAIALPVDHPWAPTLCEMVAVSSSPAIITQALSASEFVKHFANREARHYFAWFFQWPEKTPLPRELRGVLFSLPAEITAVLLRLTNGKDEHAAFARIIAEAAFRRAARPGVDAEAGYRLSWSRPLDEERAWWSVAEIEREFTTNHSDLSLVWGVDRTASEDVWAGAAQDGEF
ncbi:MAG: hypothetical protein ABI273_02740, partial [Lacunisphaera sp.]